MKPYTLANIYGHLKTAVRLWPIVAHKPNTFAVLSSFSDLDSPNLGKVIQDKNKPYFYSKAWADKQYNPSRISWGPPGIFLFERQGTIDVDAGNVIRYTVQLAVLDTIEMNSEMYVKAPGDQRSPMEIFEDTEDVLLQILGFLRDLDLGNAWTHQYRALFQRDNPSLTWQRWEGGSAKLYGNATELTFSIPCSIGSINSLELQESKTESEIQTYHRSQPMPEEQPALLTDFDDGGLTGFDDEDLTEFP